MSAFDKGFTAFYNGGKNPYAASSNDWQEWRNGNSYAADCDAIDRKLELFPDNQKVSDLYAPR